MALALFLTLSLGIAAAKFNSTTSNANNGVNAYTVPAPTNFRCGGILNLVNPQLLWDPVTVVGGATVSYQVTDPNNVVTTTSGTTYNLKNTLPLLVGTYKVHTLVTSWNNWTSVDTTKTLTLNVLGLLYVCL